MRPRCPGRKIVAMIAIASFALVLVESAAGAASAAPSAPVCTVASHDRLLVRVDRDVCGPTLNRAGMPIAMGLLPTRCRDEAHIYRIDAAGRRDQCVAPK